MHLTKPMDGEEFDEDEDEDYDPDENYNGAATVASICRQCGCHDYMACFHIDVGPCWWHEQPSMEPDGVTVIGPLCSHCAMENNGLANADEIERCWRSSE